MKSTLAYKCDLFADNYLQLKKAFKWQYSINTRLAALLYSIDNRVADIEAIRRCRKIIQDNTGVFSQFKDLTNLTVAVMLSLHSEPEASFRGILSVYNEMKEAGFHSSHYLVLAATSIALNVDSFHYRQTIALAKNHYDSMKEDHMFITNSDDYGIAALLAISEKPVSQTEREMENCYRILKNDFFGSNAVQSLAQVLSFSDADTANKCRKVRELQNELKKRKCKFGAGIELSLLGVLSLLPIDSQSLAEEIAEATEYLRNKKGLGNWSITARERLWFAASLLCCEHLDSSEQRNLVELSVSYQVIAMLLAQQMAAITSTTAAAAAASSSAASS